MGLEYVRDLQKVLVTQGQKELVGWALVLLFHNTPSFSASGVSCQGLQIIYDPSPSKAPQGIPQLILRGRCGDVDLIAKPGTGSRAAPEEIELVGLDYQGFIFQQNLACLIY